MNMQRGTTEWPVLYRRRFVVELLMSLHDSPLANGHTKKLALHTLTAVPFVPAYAKDLMSRTGNTAAVMHLFLHYRWNILCFATCPHAASCESYAAHGVYCAIPCKATGPQGIDAKVDSHSVECTYAVHHAS